ncbi:MAG: aminotransferase class I/II-fold pyridoxal phosphate-dependent enzyme [Rhodospirillales bacterium]|nr:aminotransferase class I/II-fold pyridoxal phosphate-dependent enzyme [Rhodospirillales bacterium]
MDIFDKYSLPAARHEKVLKAGTDPFGVRMEELYSATEARVDGKRTILVGTNNYLGLTYDPLCMEAAIEAIRVHGTGTTGSRIANGTYATHVALERALATFLDKRSAMVFPTGYQANLGILSGLAGANDVILLDADSHASIYDGCRLSGATLVRFRHNDPADLDKRLARLGGDDRCKLVVVEGIYSMLGDRAPLREFAEVKRSHGAYLLVDEAHSLGVLGDHGRGVAEEQGIEHEVDFVVGTFSKSLGAVGGFGASSHPKFDVLRYCSRPYMFTASASPSNVASVLAALREIERRPDLRRRLWANARALFDGVVAAGFEVCAEMSPVIALRMKDEETAIYAWNRLLERGVYVNLALPPGTPNGACLLRASVSAAHTPEQIAEVIARFGALAEDLAALERAAGARIPARL